MYTENISLRYKFFSVFVVCFNRKSQHFSLCLNLKSQINFELCFALPGRAWLKAAGYSGDVPDYYYYISPDQKIFQILKIFPRQDLAAEVEHHRDMYLSLDSTGKKLVSGLDSQEDATLLRKRLEEMNTRWSYLKAKSMAIRYCQLACFSPLSFQNCEKTVLFTVILQSSSLLFT